MTTRDLTSLLPDNRDARPAGPTRTLSSGSAGHREAGNALTGRDRQVRAAGSAKCPANNTRTSTADSQPGRPSTVVDPNDFLRPAVPVDDDWVERLVAETERTAAARRVERERRALYREALMPVRVPDPCRACGGSGVQGTGTDSWTCEECGEL